jgi:putative hydrolase of the HAD superfamily
LLAKKDEFEAGRIAPEDYIPWALGVMESTATHDEFRHAWCDIFTPNQPMWSCVEQLAADGHKLILFSNTNAIHCPWVLEEYPVFSHFHGGVLSFEVGEIKPHDAIYQHAIDAWSLDPRETLYIDDLPENTATGERLGFRCHTYDARKHDDFLAWLHTHID